MRDFINFSVDENAPDPVLPGEMVTFLYAITQNPNVTPPPDWYDPIFLRERPTFQPGGNGQAPVPEPATMFLLGSGLVGIGVLGKKFRKRQG